MLPNDFLFIFCLLTNIHYFRTIAVEYGNEFNLMENIAPLATTAKFSNNPYKFNPFIHPKQIGNGKMSYPALVQQTNK
jgi:hypothetical protein